MSDGAVRQGFSPGEGAPGVSNPPVFPDATDQLLESAIRDAPSDVRGMLILADGTKYEGVLFGAEGIAEGELVFTTGMAGYQESLTDPSFAGQVLTFTWPLLGNYGIIPGISESSRVHPRGVVCKQMMRVPDHRDSVGSVHDLLVSHGIPGIEGVDTRDLTTVSYTHLRAHET